MDLGIANQHALVCGASRGIGFACANALAEAGASVTLVARGAEELDQAAHRLEVAHSVRVETIAADLSSEAGCKLVVEARPHVELLVTNCGGAPVGDFATFTRKDWIAALNLNMLSALDLIGAYLPGMRERRYGRIVNILNVVLLGGYPDLSLSAGATGGLAAAIGSLVHAAARNGVAINNILPGRFATDRLAANMAHDAALHSISDAEVRARRLQRQCVPRFGDPGEIGDLCAFLCGRNAGYIIGQNIVIDGGSFAYAV